MKLDIYVGTLNRYYRKDWKVDNEQTSVKIQATQGKTCFKNIKTSIKEEDTSKENIRQTIAEWMDLLLVQSQSLQPLIPWCEGDEVPYFADSCGQEAYNALGLFQAGYLCKIKKTWGLYAFHDVPKKKLPFPSVITQDKPLLSHPLFKEIVAKEIPTSLATYCSMWLPLDSEMLIVSPLPMQKEYGVVSSIPYLEKELEIINKLKWKAKEKEILSWRDSEYYVPLAKKRNIFQFFSGGVVPDRYNTESLAKCAYSILYRAVKFAKRHNVPIVLDCWDGDVCLINPQKK